jgi:hypothetical protein
MSDIIGGKWEAVELLAVMWSSEMAERFPNADHSGCRQELRATDAGFEPFDPPRCFGWHCNRCGRATNCYGHHNCPDRPQK